VVNLQWRRAGENTSSHFAGHCLVLQIFRKLQPLVTLIVFNLMHGDDALQAK